MTTLRLALAALALSALPALAGGFGLDLPRLDFAVTAPGATQSTQGAPVQPLPTPGK